MTGLPHDRLGLTGLLVLGALVATGAAWPAEAREDADDRRQRHRLVRRHVAPEVADTGVLRAMRSVPRHYFVPRGHRSRAYENRPLPIGHGQTISQPLIVARMTELLKLDPEDAVLEIGTGSGYQAAVLAEIVDRVYTVEIIPELARRADAVLDALGYGNVVTRVGDGYYGWDERAPFDGILVTAAPSHIPPSLIEQLKPGGRLVIPVGPPYGIQRLMLVVKRTDGSLRQRSLGRVRFVPFRRGDTDAAS